MTLIIIGVAAWFLGIILFAGGGVVLASSSDYNPSIPGTISLILGWIMALGGVASFILGICLQVFN